MGVHLVPDPAHESSPVLSAQTARSYDGRGSPAKPRAALRSRRVGRAPLFNELIRSSEGSRRQRDADGLGCLEVNNEHPPPRVLKRKITRLCTVQDLLHVPGRLAVLIDDVRRVRHEPTCLGDLEMTPDGSDTV